MNFFQDLDKLNKNLECELNEDFGEESDEELDDDVIDDFADELDEIGSGTDPLDVLVEFLRENLPDTIYLKTNFARYNEAVEAMRAISDIALDTDDKSRIKAEPDPLLGTSLGLQIKTSIFIVDEMDKFIDALKKADSFEAVALTDGAVEINVGFNNVFYPVKPTEAMADDGGNDSSRELLIKNLNDDIMRR